MSTWSACRNLLIAAGCLVLLTPLASSASAAKPSVTLPSSAAVQAQSPGGQDHCGHFAPVAATGGRLCSHGPDGAEVTHQAAVGNATRRTRSTPLSAATAAAAAPCVGDGKSGKRIRVFYGVPTDRL